MSLSSLFFFVLFIYFLELIIPCTEQRSCWTMQKQEDWGSDAEVSFWSRQRSNCTPHPHLLLLFTLYFYFSPFLFPPTFINQILQLHGFEFPKAIYIEHIPFSEDNNLLTPTFKLRRPNLKEHYQTIIADIYATYKKAHPDAWSLSISTCPEDTIKSIPELYQMKQYKTPWRNFITK